MERGCSHCKQCREVESSENVRTLASVGKDPQAPPTAHTSSSHVPRTFSHGRNMKRRNKAMGTRLTPPHPDEPEGLWNRDLNQIFLRRAREYNTTAMG